MTVHTRRDLVNQSFRLPESQDYTPRNRRVEQGRRSSTLPVLPMPGQILMQTKKSKEAPEQQQQHEPPLTMSRPLSVSSSYTFTSLTRNESSTFSRQVMTTRSSTPLPQSEPILIPISPTELATQALPLKPRAPSAPFGTAKRGTVTEKMRRMLANNSSNSEPSQTQAKSDEKKEEQVIIVPTLVEAKPEPVAVENVETQNQEVKVTTESVVQVPIEGTEKTSNLTSAANIEETTAETVAEIAVEVAEIATETVLPLAEEPITKTLTTPYSSPLPVLVQWSAKYEARKAATDWSQAKKGLSRTLWQFRQTHKRKPATDKESTPVLQETGNSNARPKTGKVSKIDVLESLGNDWKAATKAGGVKSEKKMVWVHEFLQDKSVPLPIENEIVQESSPSIVVIEQAPIVLPPTSPTRRPSTLNPVSELHAVDMTAEFKSALDLTNIPQSRPFSAHSSLQQSSSNSQHHLIRENSNNLTLPFKELKEWAKSKWGTSRPTSALMRAEPHEIYHQGSNNNIFIMEEPVVQGKATISLKVQPPIPSPPPIPPPLPLNMPERPTSGDSSADFVFERPRTTFNPLARKALATQRYLVRMGSAGKLRRPHTTPGVTLRVGEHRPADPVLAPKRVSKSAADSKQNKNRLLNSGANVGPVMQLEEHLYRSFKHDPTPMRRRRRKMDVAAVETKAITRTVRIEESDDENEKETEHSVAVVDMVATVGLSSVHNVADNEENENTDPIQDSTETPAEEESVSLPARLAQQAIALRRELAKKYSFIPKRKKKVSTIPQPFAFKHDHVYKPPPAPKKKKAAPVPLPEPTILRAVSVHFLIPEKTPSHHSLRRSHQQSLLQLAKEEPAPAPVEDDPGVRDSEAGRPLKSKKVAQQSLPSFSHLLNQWEMELCPPKDVLEVEILKTKKLTDFAPGEEKQLLKVRRVWKQSSREEKLQFTRALLNMKKKKSEVATAPVENATNTPSLSEAPVSNIQENVMKESVEMTETPPPTEAPIENINMETTQATENTPVASQVTQQQNMLLSLTPDASLEALLDALAKVENAETATAAINNLMRENSNATPSTTRRLSTKQSVSFSDDGSTAWVPSATTAVVPESTSGSFGKLLQSGSIGNALDSVLE